MSTIDPNMRRALGPQHEVTPKEQERIKKILGEAYVSKLLENEAKREGDIPGLWKRLKSLAKARKKDQATIESEGSSRERQMKASEDQAYKGRGLSHTQAGEDRINIEGNRREQEEAYNMGREKEDAIRIAAEKEKEQERQPTKKHSVIKTISDIFKHTKNTGR